MKMVDEYIKWFAGEIDVAKAGGWSELTLPFLDRNNDHLQFYLKEIGGNVVITDDGRTFSNLELVGFQRTEKRLDIMATIFRGFQIEWTEDARIELTCSKGDFPRRFHSLVQTVIAVDNLGYLSRENVRSMFLEDVAAYLREKEITYHANEEVRGKSGLNINFPFYIPAHKEYGKAYVQLVNQPKVNLKPILFEWSDTKNARPKSKSISLINDLHIKPSQRFLKAFEEYEVVPILWSKKEDFVQELAG